MWLIDRVKPLFFGAELEPLLGALFRITECHNNNVYYNNNNVFIECQLSTFNCKLIIRKKLYSMQIRIFLNKVFGVVANLLLSVSCVWGFSKVWENNVAANTLSNKHPNRW